MIDSVNMTEKRTKAFLINMSNGSPIQIDEEEIQKVVAGIASGSVVVVRRGIINPSFVVSITQDEDRVQALFEQRKYKKEAQLEPLKNMFENSQLDIHSGHLLK